MRPADPVNPLEPEGGSEPAIPWAGLRCHSAFSFIDGRPLPDLVANAARLGLDTLAAPALRAIPGAVPALPLLAVGG